MKTSVTTAIANSFDRFCKHWQNICWACGMVVFVVGFCWTILAVPRIDKQIHTHVDPINDALMYQNCLIVQRYTAEEIANAERMYISIKRSQEKPEK